MSEWKSQSSKPEDGVIGNWLTKDDVCLAGFVQDGIGAVTIYCHNQSNIFLTWDNDAHKVKIQYEDADKKVHWIDADEIEKLLKIKKLFPESK